MRLAERFGHNLASHREQAGLSQEELGVRASLHRTAVSQLERGERVPRLDTVIKLAGSLGIEVAPLVQGLSWTPGGTVYGHFEVPDQGASL